MKNLRIALVVVLCVALIGGYYFYLTHRQPKAAEDDVVVTEVDEIISKQLDTAYPATPREVVKFYNRIISVLYGEEYTSEQFDQIASQARKLMDEELLAENPASEYKQQLQVEIAEYKDASRKIIQTTVCDSDEVVYKTIENQKCAYVTATYFMKEGRGEFKRSYERYLLRQNEEGQWKILAYQLTEKTEG